MNKKHKGIGDHVKRIKAVFFLVLALCCMGNSIILAHETEIDDEAAPQNDELTNGYEHFGEGSGKARASFFRTGTWIISYQGKVYQANRRSVVYEAGRGNISVYHVPNLGDIKSYQADANTDITEISEIAPRTIVFNKARPLYRQPIFQNQHKMGSIPAGKYTVTKVGCEWVYLEYEAGKYAWVNTNYSAYGTWEGDSDAYFEGIIDTLSVNDIRGIPLTRQIIPIRVNNRANTPMVPLYVTIHNTANYSAGANAQAHANLQSNGNGGSYTSWHFTVDDHSIFQSLPMSEIAYHAGDGMGMGNGRTVAIEICENADGNYAKAEQNAALLTARILFELGLPADAVKQHHDWSGKNCPQNIIEMSDHSMGWDGFKRAVAQEYAKIEAETIKFDPNAPAGSEAYLNAAGLHYMSETVSGIALNTAPLALVEKVKQGGEGNVALYDKAGNVKTDGIVVTGDVLKIEEADQSFVFTCVIKGDLNGDGKINAVDYVLLENHIVKTQPLRDAYFFAGDVNQDQKVSAIDYVMMENHIMKIALIDQK